MNSSNSRTSGFYLAILLTGAIFYAGGLLHGRFIGRGWPFDLDATKTDANIDHASHEPARDFSRKTRGSNAHGKAIITSTTQMKNECTWKIEAFTGVRWAASSRHFKYLPIGTCKTASRMRPAPAIRSRIVSSSIMAQRERRRVPTE